MSPAFVLITRTWRSPDDENPSSFYDIYFVNRSREGGWQANGRPAAAAAGKLITPADSARPKCPCIGLGAVHCVRENY